MAFFPKEEVPLMDDRSMEFFGVVKNLEIIGEASYKLSKEFIAAHPQTEWRAMINMRHIMVHSYYHVSARIVKEIIEQEIHRLRNQVAGYIEELRAK